MFLEAMETAVVDARSLTAGDRAMHTTFRDEALELLDRHRCQVGAVGRLINLGGELVCPGTHVHLSVPA